MSLSTKNQDNCHSPEFIIIHSLLTVSHLSLPWSPPKVHEHLVAQNSYDSQFQQSSLQHSDAWPGGFINRAATLGNSQVNAADNNMDITRNYRLPPQNIRGGDPRMDATPTYYCFYRLVPQMAQSTNHQQPYIDDGQYSFMQPHAPIPLPPGYLGLPSPPRTSSSHSHYGTSVMQPEDPASRRVSFQSNRSTPNPPPATLTYNDINSHPQLYSPSSPANIPIYPSGPSPSGHPSSYFEISPPDQHTPPDLPNDGLSPSESRPPPQRKRKRAEGSPDLQPSQQKRKTIARSDQLPVASGSRVTLDTSSQEHSPPTSRRKGSNPQTKVGTPPKPCGSSLTNRYRRPRKKMLTGSTTIERGGGIGWTLSINR